MLKKRKQLEGFVRPSLQAGVTESDGDGGESTTVESVEEFQDGVYQQRTIEDYLDDYEDVSGDMTDEDYL